MARAQWGKGKHQVLVLKDEIFELLRDGKNLEEIFNEFTSAEKITVGKRTFKRHARLIQQTANIYGLPVRSNDQATTPSVSTNVTTAISLLPPQPATFNHSPTVDNDTVDSIWNGRSDSTHTQLKTTEDTTP